MEREEEKWCPPYLCTFPKKTKGGEDKEKRRDLENLSVRSQTKESDPQEGEREKRQSVKKCRT